MPEGGISAHSSTARLGSRIWRDSVTHRLRGANSGKADGGNRNRSSSAAPPGPNWFSFMEVLARSSGNDLSGLMSASRQSALHRVLFRTASGFLVASVSTTARAGRAEARKIRTSDQFMAPALGPTWLSEDGGRRSS